MISVENAGMLQSRSRYNIEEVEMVTRLVRDIIGKYMINSKSDGKLEIGIISFYSAQVSIISQLLRKSGVELNSRISLKVMTVDGYQGSEADIVILSFVRSNRKNCVGFLKDFQRLNVALTRAKHHLIMIGDAGTLELSDCVDLTELVADVKKRRFFVRKEEFLRSVPTLL